VLGSTAAAVSGESAVVHDEEVATTSEHPVEATADDGEMVDAGAEDDAATSGADAAAKRCCSSGSRGRQVDCCGRESSPCCITGTVLGGCCGFVGVYVASM
jgi:hypothetical protein